MGSRISCALGVALALLAAATAAESQQDRKVPRIGVLMTGAASAASPYVQGFAEGLRELGYREGDNVRIDYRWVEGADDSLRAAAAELVRMRVDVLVAWGTPAAKAAKQTTSVIPIVFVAVGDPVGTALVSSLTRPGGNVTGLTNMSAELSAKQLELLRDVLPGLTRVAVLRNPGNPVSAPQLRWTKTAAEPMGLELVVVDAREPRELDAAFAAMAKGRAGAVTVLADPMLLSERTRVAVLAARHRLPTTFNWRQYAEAGGLIAYGPNLAELWRRGATFVDRLLRGAKAADMPVEQPTKLELVINQGTARAIGVTIPPQLLLRADQVID